MWLLYATIAMFGSTVWYTAPKFFPDKNPFAALFFSGIVMALLALLCGPLWINKIPVDGTTLKYSLMNGVGVFIATIGLILALGAGGKMGPIAVIIEISLIITALVGFFFFKEHLNYWQIFGILLAFTGVSFVIFFEK